MLEIQNVSFHYSGGKDVLSNISIKLERGGICGLLGLNGSGKSTMLYLIAGLLKPISGQILLDGVNITPRTPETLSKIFIVPEEYDLPNTSLKRYINVLRPLYPRFSDEILHRCLECFDMASIDSLSGLSMGQKKKVYICIALATNTELLLLDEPSNGLDIPSKSQFRRVLAAGMTEDKTVIISTHQVHDVELLLDHVTMIDCNNVLINESMAALSDILRFGEASVAPQHAIYAEQSLHGVRFIAPRDTDFEETAVDLELLFNAAIANRQALNTILNSNKNVNAL